MNGCDGNYTTRSPRGSPLRFGEHVPLWKLRCREVAQLAWTPWGKVNPGPLTARRCSCTSVPSLSWWGGGGRGWACSPWVRPCQVTVLGLEPPRMGPWWPAIPGRPQSLCSPVVLDVLLHFIEAHGVAQGQVVGAGLYRGAPVHPWGAEHTIRNPRCAEWGQQPSGTEGPPGRHSLFISF